MPAVMQDGNLMESPEQLFQSIDQIQQKGYVFWDKGRAADACRIWQPALELVGRLMRSGLYPSAEALDRDFHGRHSLGNWAADYGDALFQAGADDRHYWQECRNFCRQYLAWSSRPNDLSNRNRRRLLAECAYLLGSPDEGDALFQAYLLASPGWSWGWIKWASQYAQDVRAPWHDLKRAEQILRQGLQAEHQEDRPAVAAKLREVLTRQGRLIEASGIT
jgi:hypothetical protein